LRSELQSARESLAATKEEALQLGAENKTLSSKVEALEAALLSSRDEASHANDLAKQMQYACASIALHATESQQELFRSQEREQKSARAAVDQTVLIAQLENAQYRALIEARQQECTMRSSETLIEISKQLLETVKSELLDARSLLAEQKLKCTALEVGHKALSEESAAQRAALEAAYGRLSSLHMRNTQLENELAAKDALERKVNESQPFPLITVTARDHGKADSALCAASKPIRCDSLCLEDNDCFSPYQNLRNVNGFGSPSYKFGHALDAELPLLAGHLSRELASLPARRDYPRCSRSKQLRSRILGHATHQYAAASPYDAAV
jgi:hypothetical protein